MTKRKHAHSWPPMGSYPLPDGTYAYERVHADKDGRRIRVVAKLRTEPDTKALARVVIELAKQLERQKRTKVDH